MLQADIYLRDPSATTKLGKELARHLSAGDTILLDGPIGAGKSHLARAIILAKLANEGRVEDVPSPTYTLVQTYATDATEIWHADLYRLSHPDEVLELGLNGAFDTAVCLVEWPDRLAEDRPHAALSIRLTPTECDQRIANLSATDQKWRTILEALMSS